MRLVQRGHALAFCPRGRPLVIKSGDTESPASHFEVCEPHPECESVLAFEDRIYRVWRQTRKMQRDLKSSQRAHSEPTQRSARATVCLAVSGDMPPVIVEGRRTELNIGLPPHVPPEHTMLFAVNAATVEPTDVSFEIFALEHVNRTADSGHRRRRGVRQPRRLAALVEASSNHDVEAHVQGDGLVSGSLDRTSVSDLVQSGSGDRKRSSMSGALSPDPAASADAMPMPSEVFLSHVRSSWPWPKGVPRRRFLVHILDLKTDEWKLLDTACVTRFERRQRYASGQTRTSLG